jgi:four helix bundle protein
MRYTRFEDLPVWNTAIELAVQVYALTSRPEFKGHWSLRDQIERAAVSVSNNIAEGFERGTNNELLAFLYIARGSAGEVRSMLCLLNRLSPFQSLDAEIESVKIKAESCSRQLKAWIKSIQDSSFKGERHVNSRTKRRAQEALERDEFMKELSEVRARGARSPGRPD